MKEEGREGGNDEEGRGREGEVGEAIGRKVWDWREIGAS